MKKTIMMFLLCLLVPACASAQGLDAFIEAMGEGTAAGITGGARQVFSALDTDLSLSLSASDARVEEGRTMTLTIAAHNPRPQQTPVSIEVMLPSCLSANMKLAWDAVLPAAKVDPASGEITPSELIFTREIGLAPGAGSMQASIVAEMSVGSRFYRANLPVKVCVSDVQVQAFIPDGGDGRMKPGEEFAYCIEVTNAGAAARDVEIKLTLPKGAEMSGDAPQGFTFEDGVLSGLVRAEAAAEDEAGAAASLAVVQVPVRVSEDVLSGDEDAVKLLSGELQADGKDISLPRIQACGPRISARLVAQKETLQAGEEMDMHILVMNSGLAQADVTVSCMLPDGLEIVPAEATPGEAEDGAETVMAEMESEPAQLGEGALTYTVHMDAAREGEAGMEAATHTYALRVRATQDQDALLGAALAWSTDEGEVQLGKAVAVQVERAGFMGIAKEEWNAVFWAAALMVMAVVCLYAAVRPQHKEEYSCE